MGKISLFIRKIVIGCLVGYRYFISPLWGQHCRFYPSCSHYALNAIEERGLLHGLVLVIRRLLRCHPWCAGGYDPVPSKK